MAPKRHELASGAALVPDAPPTYRWSAHNAELRLIKSVEIVYLA